MRDIPALSLTWRDGLFAHWPVEADRVRPLVPDELDVDTRKGSAWVSALPSVAAGVRPASFPASAGLTFPQVNLRTYVRYETEPGVYFLSLDTTTELGVRLARSAYGLPYYHADVEFERSERPTDARSAEEGGEDGTTFDCHFASERDDDAADAPARFSATYRPAGDPFRAPPGSLEAFLAERYRLYVVRDGTVWCARVDRDPWRLREAEATVYADSLWQAAGLPAPADEPLLRYSSGAAFEIRTPFRP
ncbi:MULTISPECIES: YqjF family protein [Halorussus]|uniref:YqjF family protein n=1 Tax=Halorussus TaxID=1070314 RepID=UPI00209CF5A6|nr:DUF2071 domain-containing protein [Halorussus vallis]